MDDSCMTRRKSEQTRDEVETGLKDPKTDVNNTVQRIYLHRDGDSDSDSDLNIDVEFGEENFDLTVPGLKEPKPDNNTVQRAADGTLFNITNNCSTANIHTAGRSPVPVDMNIGNAAHIRRRDVYDLEEQFSEEDFVGWGRPPSPLFRMNTETTNVIRGATGPLAGVPPPPPPPQPGIAYM